MESWDNEKSANLYNVLNWSDGYFSINHKGEICVRPERNGIEVSLHDIVSTLVQRSINVPVLLRFDQIIADRVNRLQAAFQSAIQESGFRGRYQEVYPIKVNQQRHVVDAIKRTGEPYGLGLEVGSKPELMAVLAVHDGLILCNGYKDTEYIELACMGRRLGRRVIVILEQPAEIDMILAVCQRLNLDIELGIRLKLTAKGSGKWEDSGGEQAKFGLTTPEVLQVINRLSEAKKSDWLKLVHFHVGSQITSIQSIKKVLKEGTRMYTEIARLCPSLCLIDVGGGLAVDYDGSKTNFAASMDYTMEEYARDVVYAVCQACDAGELPHPGIITESGRAIVAHHAVLVVQATEVAKAYDVIKELPAPPTKNRTLKEFKELHDNINVKNCRESLHDALNLRDDLLQQFIAGNASLEERAYGDVAYWQVLAKIKKVGAQLRNPPEEFEKLSDDLKDTYFCNFSVFQSLPDAWAIDQLFPIIPIQRLNEEPARRAIIADMSCDSDGKIEHFIDVKDVNPFLLVHPLKENEPYYLGIFLAGAYQEILGDLHNLFGDTNAVHVAIGPAGQPSFTHVVEGDTIREVLVYVEYEAADLTERLRQCVEKALAEGRLTNEEAGKFQKRYKEALEGYTYLDV